jgi:DNA-binding NarL/FixJ family response regulator
VRGDQLIEAIRAVYAGESVLHPSTTRRVIDQLTARHTGPTEGPELTPLTERELEVLKLAAKGVSNNNIAEKMGLSDRTVQAHLSNIFKKLTVASRTEAILYSLKRGWFSMEDLP